MKRFLYVVALICLVGLCVSLTHLYGYTNTVGNTMDAAADGDQSAMADLKDFATMHGTGDDWLERAFVFGAGFAVAGFLGRRAR